MDAPNHNTGQAAALRVTDADTPFPGHRVVLGGERPFARKLQELHSVLATTDLRSPVLWILDSGWRKFEIAQAQWQQGERSPELERHLAAGALAERRYAEAAHHFASIAPEGEASPDALLAAYALLLDGRGAQAAEWARASGIDVAPGYAEGWKVLQGWIADGS